MLTLSNIIASVALIVIVIFTIEGVRRRSIQKIDQAFKHASSSEL